MTFRRFLPWLGLILASACCTGAGVIRVACFRAFRVPTGSMQKTILPGDYLLADMTAYGVRLPFSDSMLFGARRPARGDVIVFRFPEDRRRMFIMRVIGLPGESVAVRGRGVYVDAKRLPESYAVSGGGPFDEPTSSVEPLPERLEEAGDGDSLSTRFGPATVPAGAVFVLGDNRDNSRDSRFWGFLPLDDVRGKAWRIYFSKEPRTGKVRGKRIGRAIR